METHGPESAASRGLGPCQLTLRSGERPELSISSRAWQQLLSCNLPILANWFTFLNKSAENALYVLPKASLDKWLSDVVLEGTTPRPGGRDDNSST